jgi:hypothetical protein
MPARPDRAIHCFCHECTVNGGLDQFGQPKGVLHAVSSSHFYRVRSARLSPEHAVMEQMQNETLLDAVLDPRHSDPDTSSRLWRPVVSSRSSYPVDHLARSLTQLSIDKPDPESRPLQRLAESFSELSLDALNSLPRPLPPVVDGAASEPTRSPKIPRDSCGRFAPRANVTPLPMHDTAIPDDKRETNIYTARATDKVRVLENEVAQWRKGLPESWSHAVVELKNGELARYLEAVHAIPSRTRTVTESKTRLIDQLIEVEALLSKATAELPADTRPIDVDNGTFQFSSVSCF